LFVPLNYLITGTQVQARYKKQMNSKMILLKKKWTAYNNQASNYNSEFTPETELETPTFDEIKQFGIKNTFWNSGWLDHPNKAWAVDLDTQKGIQAYLTITHCQDELHRIAREARQAVKWALLSSQKIDCLQQLFQARN
jgi:hypothetical protein